MTGAKSALDVGQTEVGGNPAGCPNGKYLLFENAFHGAMGNDDIWRMDSSGENVKQLTSGKRDHNPLCSPDSKWVYYVAEENEPVLNRVSIDGGMPQNVSQLPLNSISISLQTANSLPLPHLNTPGLTKRNWQS